MGKKLDLSKLTDEEATHVWGVVQRDFDLRKKEEDRLGELKTKIEKEDTKMVLLGQRSNLTESHCIRCLQPFKFLVNSKRQCLDCQLYTCKSCSRYNKKEQGWVCDPCRMARVLKIGTLEWYHENVRARFKRFGSAKVMRSLFKRLNGEHILPQNDPGADAYEEHNMDATDLQHYKRMKKTKRRLTVDPIDFDLDSDDFIDRRRKSYQAQSSLEITEQSLRDQKILETNLTDQEPKFSSDVGLSLSHRMSLGTAPRNDDQDHRTTWSRSISRLSFSSHSSGSMGGPRCSSSIYLPGPDESEEGEDGRLPYRPHMRCCSHTSQESLNSATSAPQVTELNMRMSAIESILNRLELKVTSTYKQGDQTPITISPPPPWEEVDVEEQQLRQKLSQMTDNISDHSLTDEDEPNGPPNPHGTPAWRCPEADASPTKAPTRPASRTGSLVSTAEVRQSEQMESEKMSHSTEDQAPDEGSKTSSTALLVVLEDKVAQAAADVQNAQSQVSYIEDRIAALNAAGMPVDKGKRRSAIPIQSRRLSHNVPTNQVDRFVRNSIYTGSLTQRNPLAKAKPKAGSAKPVMSQGS
ncbi:melanophilin [Genypterus blacodes]|uniref:melanophilin n=1 Tax=Genypterus blacodes TaxID=154954 RepID=UPI003F7666DF